MLAIHAYLKTVSPKSQPPNVFQAALSDWHHGWSVSRAQPQSAFQGLSVSAGMMIPTSLFHNMND